MYLKYRPKTIDQLDLAGVRQALGEILLANKVAHAYLFTGPRGAGKTSSARILARVINCEHNDKKLSEPCNECPACISILNGGSLDFVEIDAASNRGIDDIRELKEKIRLAPSDLKYKIYIIDEVHMLTTEAFNALLKTLEEPPAHAIFILCTTETHKVPETIQSRCVRVNFTKATPEEMERSFTRVITGEGKKVQKEAMAYLARSVDGSFRDGVKILDSVLAKYDEVTLAEMEEAVMGLSGFKIGPLTEALIARNTILALETLHEATDKGIDLTYLTVSLMKEIRDRLIAGAESNLTKLVFALDDVARKLSTSPVPELLIEMVIIEWGGGIIKVGGSRDGGEGATKKKDTSAPIKPKSTNTEKVTTLPSAKQESEEQVKVMIDNLDHQDVWKQLMKSLNGDSITLGALLSKARPAQLAGDVLTINVAYGFHRDQIMSDKVLRKLEDAIERAVGRSLRVVCEVATSVSASKGESSVVERVVDTGDTIDEAIAIFS